MSKQTFKGILESDIDLLADCLKKISNIMKKYNQEGKEAIKEIVKKLLKIWNRIVLKDFFKIKVISKGKVKKDENRLCYGLNKRWNKNEWI